MQLLFIYRYNVSPVLMASTFLKFHFCSIIIFSVNILLIIVTYAAHYRIFNFFVSFTPDSRLSQEINRVCIEVHGGRQHNYLHVYPFCQETLQANFTSKCCNFVIPYNNDCKSEMGQSTRASRYAL